MNTRNRQSDLAGQKTQKGVAVIEAAIVLPVVLVVMLVVAEFGHAILQYNRLTQAVRDGARYIAAEAEAGPGIIILNSDKVNDTVNLVAYGMTNGGSAEVLPGFDPGRVDVVGVNGADVSVTAEYDYTPMFLPTFPTLTGGADTTGAFTMRAEVIMRIL